MYELLKGVRVLDLSRILAGPWASQTLGDLGAEIIKIERVQKGDDTRSWGPPFLGETAAYYHACNRNKKSVAVDFTTPEGQEIIRDLVRHCDVVIENFKVGGLKKYGLDYDNLKALKPDLIYCSITGFGQDGPYAERAGYDFLIQGMGGLMSLTGEPEAQPLKVGVALADILTGLYVSNAVQAALLNRQQTGQGHYIDLALLDVQVASLANQAMNYQATGQNPQRLGNAHPNIVPYQAFATKDGHMILAVGNDGQFQRFCQAAGHAELSADDRFATNAARVAHREILVPILADIIQGHSLDWWIETLEAAKVPCGPINTLDRVFADPQVRHRGMVQNLDGYASISTPIHIPTAERKADSAPPKLGQDTATVLKDKINLTEDRLKDLAKQGVIDT